jgi:hypothetical protein
MTDQEIRKANSKARAELIDQVYANPAYSIRAKVVFYVLIGHMDLLTLQCNPGRTRMAGKLGLRDYETIKRGLAELIGFARA